MEPTDSDIDYKALAERLSRELSSLREAHAQTQGNLAGLDLKYRIAANERDSLEIDRDCYRSITYALWLTLAVLSLCLLMS